MLFIGMTGWFSVACKRCQSRKTAKPFCRPLRGFCLWWDLTPGSARLHLGLHSVAAPQLKIHEARNEMLDGAQARA